MLKREIHVDLYRILATLSVILLHVLGQGGILNESAPNSFTYWAAWLLEIFAYGAVNCFALITGYLFLEKKTSIKSILSLWFQVLFYSLLLTVFAFIVFPESRSLWNVIRAFLPILTKQWWYISSYFAVFLFIPFLNEAVHNLSKEAIEKFLIVILIAIGIFDCILRLPLAKDPFYIKEGYSALWLIILYIFGAYIKKYNIKQIITAKKAFFCFLGLIILTFASKILISVVTSKIFGQIKYSDIFISYISITIILASIFLFLFCLNVKINKITQKIITVFSPYSLGIFLIHVHPLVFSYILKNAFVSFAEKPFILMILYVFFTVFAIFLSCAALDFIRIKLFNLFKIKHFCQFLDEKTRNLCSRFW